MNEYEFYVGVVWARTAVAVGIEIPHGPVVETPDGAKRGKPPIVNEMMQTDACIGVHINTSTRSVDWITVEDIVNAIP